MGVLTQYQPLDPNTYMVTGLLGFDRNNGGVYVLPPYVSMQENKWYKVNANAIYHNIPFIEV